MNAIEWLRKADEWDDDDLGTYFFDYLTPGNASVGEALKTPDGLFTFVVQDQYFRRIEDEEVWVVLRDIVNGEFIKISGKFTSWDSISYKIEPTSREEITTTVWS